MRKVKTNGVVRAIILISGLFCILFPIFMVAQTDHPLNVIILVLGILPICIGSLAVSVIITEIVKEKLGWG